jgi:hypothetical protein
MRREASRRRSGFAPRDKEHFVNQAKFCYIFALSDFVQLGE